jgi:hypothetical protein
MASNTIIREIIFKKGCEKEADDLLERLDEIDPYKVCCTKITTDGRMSMVIRFDDALDLLAFMVAQNMVKMEIKEQEKNNGTKIS